MRQVVLALSTVVTCGPCIAATSASAQPAPTEAPHHTMRLVQLPNGDYTVPMNELLDPAWTGKVSLRAQGLKTLVTVVVFGTELRRHALELHPGSDCNSFGAANSIQLNPANTGVPSRTLVSLPITNLTSSDYVVAVRDATGSRQYQESCARW